MSVDAVAIGIALLGIVLWTWVGLRSVDKKLDKLLLLAKSRKKEENANAVGADEAQKKTKTVSNTESEGGDCSGLGAGVAKRKH